MARNLSHQGLILVDTKYEFGMIDGEPCVIDEIHTADQADTGSLMNTRRFAAGEPQRMLDKENIRQWLIGQGYQGEDAAGDPMNGVT